MYIFVSSIHIYLYIHHNMWCRRFWFTNHDLVGFRRYSNIFSLFVAAVLPFSGATTSHWRPLCEARKTILIWPLGGVLKSSMELFPMILSMNFQSFMNFSFNKLDLLVKYDYAQRIGQGLVTSCLRFGKDWDEGHFSKTSRNIFLELYMYVVLKVRAERWRSGGSP